jgi:hypothetical protein
VPKLPLTSIAEHCADRNKALGDPRKTTDDLAALIHVLKNILRFVARTKQSGDSNFSLDHLHLAEVQHSQAVCK